MIVLNADHLRRTLSEYSEYYHTHRTHRGLGEDYPELRAIEAPEQGNVVELPLTGGLHHRYARRAS